MRGGVAALCAACALGGCGAAPPQVPVSEAKRVASAISGIAEACGESYQELAFAPVPGQPRGPLLAARMRAAELADVYRNGPQWVYNGETLTQIVALAVRDLRECSLPGAAAELVRLTR